MSDMAVLARTAGGPEVLEWAALDTPAPGAGEVRVAQRAVGVNFIDTYYRSGSYPWPSTPLVPGAEAAGVIDAVGPGVKDLAVGDRVAYVMQVGAYRTRRVVPAERLVKLPDAIDFDVAASIMLKGLTAQFLLTSCYPVKAGDTVLVHAAAGGVGLLLGQWLRSIGAVAIGTVGSADKTSIALANGYSHILDNSRGDFERQVRELAPKGCDVVYDSVGKDTWRGSLKVLRPRGMFVSFGQSSGAITDFKISDLASGGSLFASRPTLFDYIRTREELRMRAEDLFARLAASAIRAHIGRRMPLAEAAEAHRALASRRTIGSTVLLVT
ncbi:MAG: quinone oxidoreductase [Steroidobacteraceae bacterium]|jgi:NADPH2:quinone reductase